MSSVGYSTSGRVSGAVSSTPQMTAASSASSADESFSYHLGAMFSAIQSGDVASAQRALSTVVGDVGTAQSPQSSCETPSVDAGDDVALLFDAVDTGDIKRAQAVLTRFIDSFNAAGESVSVDNVITSLFDIASGANGVSSTPARMFSAA